VRPLIEAHLRPLLLGLVLGPFAIGGLHAQTPADPATDAPADAPTDFPTDLPNRLPGVRPPAPPGATVQLGDAAGSPAWALAPVRWDGQLSFEERASSFDGQARRMQHMQLLSLRAASYVWQPWFVQVNSSVSVGLAQLSGADSTGGNEGSKSQVLNGSLAVAVFPQSRFPFNGNLSIADGRTSDTFNSADTRSQRLTLRQSYRNEAGDAIYTGQYDRSVLTSERLGSDRVDVMQATFTRRFADHMVDGVALRTQNSRSIDEGGSNATRLSVAHSYRPDEYLVVSSSLSDSSARLKFGSGVTAFVNRQRFRQLSTMATWTPDLPQPVLLTGSMRWSDASASTQSADSDFATGNSRVLSASGTATWRPTNNLFVGAAVSLSQFASTGLTQTLSTESVITGYTFDPRTIGGFNYQAGVNTNLAHQAGGTDRNRALMGASLTHSLARNFAITDSTSWGVNANQALALRSDTVDGRSQVLTHNLGVNLRHLSQGGMIGYAGLSLGDSRTTGFAENRFRMVNLQVSGQIPFGRYASASANLTAQAVRQSSVFVSDEGWQRYATGGFTYQHARVFGVPRLRYLASANAFNSQVNARINGDPNAPIENITWMHEQRLEYTVGRLEFRLSARLAKVDGKKNALVFLRVSRSFGSF
jgi:hypothetical protein